MKKIHGDEYWQKLFEIWLSKSKRPFMNRPPPSNAWWLLVSDSLQENCHVIKGVRFMKRVKDLLIVKSILFFEKVIVGQVSCKVSKRPPPPLRSPLFHFLSTHMVKSSEKFHHFLVFYCKNLLTLHLEVRSVNLSCALVLKKTKHTVLILMA